jgi:hypothetical protein
MGFERRRFPDHIRNNTLPDDEKIFDKCKSCPIKDVCGGHAEFLMNDDSRFCDRECWKCRAVCCKLDDIYERLDKFNGVRFDDISFNYWDREWPDFIWTIDESIDNPGNDWYALPLSALYNAGYDSWNQSKSQKSRLDLSKNNKLTVSFCMGDNILDHFTSPKSIQSLAKKLTDYDFDFMLPVNFSVYRNYPRVDQLLNMKRRLYSMKQFQHENFSSMPDLSLMTERDINRWAKWANNERISCAIMNFQTKKSENKEKYLKTVESLNEFDSKLDFNCHYFIAGVGPVWINKIMDLFENVTFLNSSAWKNASLSQSIFKNELKNLNYTKQEIFYKNKEIMKSLYHDREPKLTDKEKNDFGFND